MVILGPINISDYEHEFHKDKIFLLTITDIYSRFTIVKEMERITGNELVRIFENE